MKLFLAVIFLLVSFASPSVPIEHRVLVMLVNFQDAPANHPWTAASVNDVVFNQSKAYWESVSYQNSSFTGDFVGWYTAAINSNDCQGNFRDAVENGARALGYEPSNYAHKIYVFPYRPCGAQGGITFYSVDSFGNVTSSIYMNGVADFYSIAHEVGHSFGLRHSNLLDCGSVSIGSNCTHIEYGDHHDIMGQFSTASVNAYHREIAGWMAGRIQQADTDGTFFLAPIENTDLSLKALRITKDPAIAKSYYVEYRNGVGVFIRLGSTDPNYLGFGSELLDMTPTTNGADEQLTAGQSFYDPFLTLLVTVNSFDSNGASVSVAFGAQPAPTPAPTPVPSPTPTPNPTPCPKGWVKQGRC